MSKERDILKVKAELRDKLFFIVGGAIYIPTILLIVFVLVMLFSDADTFQKIRGLFRLLCVTLPVILFGIICALKTRRQLKACENKLKLWKILHPEPSWITEMEWEKMV